MRCYEVARKLYEASSQIQMFITSHSPAFFSVGSQKGARSYWVSKDKDTGFTIAAEGADGCQELGYMPLIAPYLVEKIKAIEEKDNEIQKLKQTIAKSPVLPGCTIMVEGITDEKYLKTAFSIHSPRLSDLVSKGKVRIFCSKENGGTKNLSNYANAWHLSKVEGRLLVLVDRDGAGRDVKCLIEKLNNPQIKAIQVPMASWIDRIFQKIVSQEHFSAPIETLFPAKIWCALEEKGLLSDRPDEELQKCFVKLIGRTKTLDEAIREAISDEDRIFVNKKPHPDKKGKIATYICGLAKDDPVIFDGFKSLVSQIENRIKEI